MSEHTTEKVKTGLSRWQTLLLVLGLTFALYPGIKLIRLLALEVTQYQVSTFESYAREALGKGDYHRVIEICTGALKAGVNRGDHWGKVHLLRAEAYGGLNNGPKALEELERAVSFWTQKYYYATDENREETARFGTELGRAFLDAGLVVEALRSFSAAGMGSGKPAEYLEQLTSDLDPTRRAKLWPGGPFLLVRVFMSAKDDSLKKVVEEQGRKLEESRIDSVTSRAGVPTAMLAVSESVHAGRSWFGLPVYLPITGKPFVLRVYAKEQTPSELGVFLSYWFEGARKSASTVDTQAVTGSGGWKCFDIRRDFHAERLAEGDQQGYSVAGGFINTIGLSLPEGPSNRIWVDRIELLPAS